jgi:predicted membrane-bound spermidine synthase
MDRMNKMNRMGKSYFTDILQILFILSKFSSRYRPLPHPKSPFSSSETAAVIPPSMRPILFTVFVLSGVSALLYQMVWQRALLTLYGSNSESVAMVVASFLCGLGIGSIAGGWVSKQPRAPLVLLFALAELIVGGYGLVSLRLFDAVALSTSGAGTLMTGVLAFALVFLPTLLMGSTLPLLVAQQVRSATAAVPSATSSTADAHIVGDSVSWLYFVNTLGAAIGAWLAVYWLLPLHGMKGSVQLAAMLNATAACTILAATAVLRLLRP